MKRTKPKPLTEEYLRAVAHYYENQPEDEAMRDIERLFSDEAEIVKPAKPIKKIVAKSRASGKVLKVSEPKRGTYVSLSLKKGSRSGSSKKKS